jgi:hypothetical protein
MAAMVVYRCSGSGRSTSFIPVVPAAWSVTTIALSPRLFVSLLDTFDI